MPRKYFGTDGVRGKVGTFPITPDFAMKLGWAAGTVLASSGTKEILIGKDTRNSGYMFESALEAGISAAGVDVRLAAGDGVGRLVFVETVGGLGMRHDRQIAADAAMAMGRRRAPRPNPRRSAAICAPPGPAHCAGPTRASGYGRLRPPAPTCPGDGAAPGAFRCDIRGARPSGERR